MKYDRSRELYERACRTTPGGIHSNVRKVWQPTPMFYERGRDAHVWDADGNEFIDYVLARGPLLFGHSPQPILDAVRRQLDVELMYAGQHTLEIEAAERFCAMVPCAEMVRFSSSGSEAVHAALRLARAVTGRPKILRFEGHYHGWFDNAFWSFAPSLEAAGPRETPRPVMMTRGQSPTDAEGLIVRPWNDLDVLKATFAAHGAEIAGVIAEPIVCNTAAIMPRAGFLAGLRELCSTHGALLIFDEIITGFRTSPGGAQQFFGVTPDLATFAKGMAGGFPISATAGKAAYMEAFGDLSVAHSGTYNSNGPCIAATIAALDMLSADRGSLLAKTHRLGRRLMDGIQQAGREAGREVHIRGVPPVFHVSFNDREEIVDYRSSLSRDTAAYDRFWLALQERGVRTVPGGLWFVSTAHTDADIDQTLDAVGETMKMI